MDNRWSEFGEQIENEDLTVEMVPQETRSWMVFARFALTYDGYSRHSGFTGCADVGNRVRDEYMSDGRLPSDLNELRAAAFFEQRRWHHYGYDPDEEAWEYLNALLHRI